MALTCSGRAKRNACRCSRYQATFVTPGENTLGTTKKSCGTWKNSGYGCPANSKGLKRSTRTYALGQCRCRQRSCYELSNPQSLRSRRQRRTCWQQKKDRSFQIVMGTPSFLHVQTCWFYAKHISRLLVMIDVLTVVKLFPFLICLKNMFPVSEATGCAGIAEYESEKETKRCENETKRLRQNL
jgi:hypothetical protein